MKVHTRQESRYIYFLERYICFNLKLWSLKIWKDHHPSKDAGTPLKKDEKVDSANYSKIFKLSFFFTGTQILYMIVNSHQSDES
ncbi:hypothetical protein AgCh_019667 [Apium graveolens]